MILSRRSFVIGVGSTAAAAFIAAPDLGLPKDVKILPSKLYVAENFDWAEMIEVTMSSFPERNERAEMNYDFVNYSFIRGEKDCLLTWGLHRSATLQWVAAPGSSIIITKYHPVRFDIEPCYSGTILTLIYNVEKDSRRFRLPWTEFHDSRPYSKNSDGWVGRVPYSKPPNKWHKRPICFSETFRHNGSSLEDHQIHALDPQDEHLIGRA